MPIAKRLSKKKDIDNVFKKGKSFYNNIIGIKIIKNNEQIIRTGVIVSNKVSKKAVERNLYKRRIRAIDRETNKNDSFDILYIALPPIKEADFNEIKESILGGLKKLKVI